jgi:hypothetical protein
MPGPCEPEPEPRTRTPAPTAEAEVTVQAAPGRPGERGWRSVGGCAAGGGADVIAEAYTSVDRPTRLRPAHALGLTP